MRNILELRDTTGSLLAFEVSDRCTSLRALCRELRKIQGLSFRVPACQRRLASTPRRREFWLGGNRYEVLRRKDRLLVSPHNAGACASSTERLLVHVRSKVVGNRWHRLLAALLPG